MKYKFIAVAAALIITGASAFYLSLPKNKHYFSCLAQYHVHNNGLRANILMRFMFEGTTGFVMLNGEFIDESGHHKVLSRKILFDFQTIKSNYLLTSTAIIPNAFDETDNHALANLLDGFYTAKNQPAQYNIHHNGKGEYIFMNGSTPVLLCATS